MYYSNFQATLNELAASLPNIAGAVLIILIGWVIAVIVAAIVRRGLQWMGADGLFEKTGVNRSPISSRTRVSNVVGAFVKWLIILGAVGIAAEIVHLDGVAAFIGSLFAYVPNILVAAVILVVGFITADKVSALIGASTTFSSLSKDGRMLVTQAAKYGIIVFSVMAALTQLNIVPQLIEIAFAGLVFALALAFGLGGREHASELIARLKTKSKTG
ncbi:MAG TPA: hypothetical protein VFS75_03615 [Candidatus Paceibacterota bacterium]|nr:hypothetical protein [Candidatus Paceibacterota bacterium]